MPTSMHDLKEKTLRGGLAKVCSQGAYFVLRIGSLMILARLLDPKDFGLVGMVTAVIGVLGLFRDFGLSTASVQRNTVTEEQLSTLFWINMLVGAVLTLIALGTAPLVAHFYHEPRLLMLTIALAPGFLINAASVQHSSILQRQMRFTTLAVIEITSFVVGTGLGILMALWGFGYWALVAMGIASPIISVVGLWAAAAWVPGRPRRQVGMSSMMRFGGTVTLNSIVVYIAYNFEKVLLGRYWGAATVGIYGRAYQLINIPTENLNSSVGGVAFSALSRLQDDPPRLRSYFLKGYSMVLALSVPITLGCALFANDLVSVVLGPKWTETAPLLQLLAPTILVFALINPLGWLLFSTGMVMRSLKLALVLSPIVITSYLIGLRYGPKGVAIGYSTAMLLWLVPHIAWCVHGTVITFWDVWSAASKPFISGGVAAALAFAVHTMLGSFLPALPRLVVSGGILTLAYALMLLYALGQKNFYINLVRGLRARAAEGGRETLATA